ncbi:MAG: PKD domain-containing protein [Crocinitomicaceae bacterium]|nr:PKD domain-containing protein [Crocinitomicaceae bacterium]
MKKTVLAFFIFLFVLSISFDSYAACPQVNAAFTTSQTNICGPGPQVISFVNTSTGVNNVTADYEWFLNGVSFDNTSGMAAPNTSNISAVGTYTYMLVVTDSSVPCTDTATVIVRIYPTPNANFTFNPNNACGGLPVTFTNSSTGTIGATTYSWNFGDGGTATTTNATHTYAAGGSYNVTLTQTNGPGCTNSETQTVTSLPIPAVAISGADIDGDLINCLLPADPSTSQIVTFSNTTTGAVSYTWDFGDGSGTFTTASNADFPHTYTSYGTFTVTMTATHANGCTATATLTVVFEKYVSAAMTLDITEYSGCAPHDLSTLTNLSVNANSYTWNFGDGTIITTASPIPPSHFYTASGSYTISLTAVNSCNTANSTISPIVIVAGPTANFNNSLAGLGGLGCAPQNVTFTNASAGTSPANNYQWNMGNGNTYITTINPPIQTYDTTGVYTITLVAGNACGFDTITTNITIDTIPVVDIVSTPLDGCSPLVVSTVNNSYEPPINYTWTVDGVFAGNGATLPNQTFINSGSYSATNHVIQLFGSNHCGSDIDLEFITVHPETIADFFATTDTICAGESILFIDQSTGENLTYAWDFGVSTETTAGPHNIQFNVAGTYVIELAVDGYCGPDVITMNVVVLPIPVADFVANPVSICVGETVSLTNNSTLGGSYAWTFQNGTPATSNVYSPAPILFNTSGSQTILLTVNLLGCIATDTEIITVNALPDPTFTLTPNNGCTPLNVSANYTGTAVGGDQYDWDLGNGSNSILQNPPTQIYTAAGADATYTVELIITSAAGCSDSSELTVLVHPLPIADYTTLPDTACAGTPIGFLNNSVGASTYVWDFGDGTNSAVVSPSHTYTVTGDITTELIAYTAFGCTDTIQHDIYIDSIPTANFIFDVVCEIDTTSFTDLSIGGVTDWSWNFGDASPLNTSQSPTHFYGNDGTYSVSLTVTNPANCTNTLTQLVNVSTVPVANFSTGSTCLGSLSSFTDLSAGITSSWQWNFDDGSPTSILQNPTHTYTAVGTYNVELIAMAGNGCSDTITLPITVTPIPTADFSFLNVCAEDETFFTDLSLGTPDTWSWNFGDGNTDNTNNPNPIHTYASSGTFNVTLTAGYSASGCTHSITQAVTAFPRTNPTFTTNTPCLGGATNFTDLTTGGPIIWQWNLGDGSPLEVNQNPVHTYASPGLFPIQLVTENIFGCIDTLNTTVQVFPLPVADFTSNVVCLNTLTAFTDLSTSAVSWQWDFGDGTLNGIGPNPFHLYTTAGNFDVELVVTNAFGCTDTLVQTITVNPNPTADFAATIACHTYPNLFTDNSTGAVLWSWDFGDASPVDNSTSPNHIYPNPGTYSVDLTVENIFGCTHSITQNVNVLIQPQADFSYNTVCAGETVQLTDLSTNTPTDFQWDFGDGSPLDFTQNPTHIFDPGGTFTLTYIVSNPAGCADTLITPITVYTVPIPEFTADTVCLFTVSSFTDLTVDAAPIATWYYDFDDGNQSFSQNPNYIFANAGIYNVTLLVTNIHGCDSSVTHPVYVSDIPVADFIADTVCTGSPTTFTDASTGFPDSWLWNFGDGNSSVVGPVTTHTYAAPGTYPVSLFVSAGGACFDQTFEFVVVSNNVQAGIIATDTICDGNAINFTDNSTISAGIIDTWFWDFGDGTTATTEDASHTYSAPGTYLVTHTVGSSSGCNSSATFTVTVTDVPVANFVEFSACQNGVTSFNDMSSIAAGTVDSWSWNFGDGSLVSTLQNPTHVYTVSGNYSVTLTVTSGFNCANSYTSPIIVYPAPIAAFIAPVACPQDTILYSDLSTISSGTITNWAWNFGDGTTSLLQNPQHGFQILSDSFDVSLIVTSNFGCTDTVIQTVLTHPFPDFAWGPDLTSGCQPLIVTFSDSSTVLNGSITNWEWSFGDSIYSFAQNPVHVYTEPGNYYVSLWVTTSDGCDFNSYVDYPIIVYPKPTAEFTPYFTEVSILEPEVQFHDLSSGAMDWEWYFGDGDYSNEVNPLHEFTDTGYFDVMQIVYSDHGCADTAIHSVYVFGEFAFFIPNTFTPNGDAKNPTWRGYAWGAVSYELMVFDRWGQLIFTTTDQTVEWDGTYHGVKVPDDVYVWKCVMLDSELLEHAYYGHVTVLK